MKVSKPIYRLALLLLCAFAQYGYGDVDAVSVSPSLLQLDVTSGLVTTVSWSVTFSTREVVSATGEYITTQAALAGNRSSIVLRPRRGEKEPRTEIASDRIFIPANTAQQWWDRGLREVNYRRIFRDTRGSSARASVRIALVNPAEPSLPTPPPVTPVPQPPASPPVSPPITPPPSPPPGTPTGPNQPAPGPSDPAPEPPGNPVIPNPQVPPSATVQGLAQLRGLQSAQLELRRLELSFSDLKVVKFVDQGEALTARLLVSYSGLGVLRGRWMLAGPTTTVGTPRFRSWRSVNQQLSASQRTELLSPQLPTDTPGRYYLQFCVDGEPQPQVEIDIDTPCRDALISTTVGYQVFPGIGQVPPIEGLQPTGGEVGRDTFFSWQPASKAVLYQIQILSERDTPAVADADSQLVSLQQDFVGGLLVPRSVTRSKLSEAVLASMKPGRHYYWRITAYDESGQLVARSQAHRFSFLSSPSTKALLDD